MITLVKSTTQRPPLLSQEDYWKQCKAEIRATQNATANNLALSCKRKLSLRQKAYRLARETEYKRLIHGLDQAFPWRKIRLYQQHERDFVNNLKCLLAKSVLFKRNNPTLRRGITVNSFFISLQPCVDKLDEGTRRANPHFSDPYSNLRASGVANELSIQEPTPSGGGGSRKTQKRNKLRAAPPVRNKPW